MNVISQKSFRIVSNFFTYCQFFVSSACYNHSNYNIISSPVYIVTNAKKNVWWDCDLRIMWCCSWSETCSLPQFTSTFGLEEDDSAASLFSKRIHSFCLFLWRNVCVWLSRSVWGVMVYSCVLSSLCVRVYLLTWECISEATPSC